MRLEARQPPAGDIQPVNPQERWNRQGMGVNGVQRIQVTVTPGIRGSRSQVPSAARVAGQGAEAVPVPGTVNNLAAQQR